MQLHSQGIQSGIIDDRFGKRGRFFVHDMPACSLPLLISEAPAHTRCFALVCEDKDAIPVCGHSWIHWLVANLTQTFLPEDAARSGTLVQGQNSWAKSLGVEKSSTYGGMAPPDKDHRYTFTVYALDCMLPLSSGFTKEALLNAMQGHVLEEATLIGIYKK